jgi:hypothetical protein
MRRRRRGRRSAPSTRDQRTDRSGGAADLHRRSGTAGDGAIVSRGHPGQGRREPLRGDRSDRRAGLGAGARRRLRAVAATNSPTTTASRRSQGARSLNRPRKRRRPGAMTVPKSRSRAHVYPVVDDPPVAAIRSARRPAKPAKRSTSLHEPAQAPARNLQRQARATRSGGRQDERTREPGENLMMIKLPTGSNAGPSFAYQESAPAA